MDVAAICNFIAETDPTVRVERFALTDQPYTNKTDGGHVWHPIGDLGFVRVAPGKRVPNEQEIRDAEPAWRAAKAEREITVRRTVAGREIDTAAEQARGQFMTPGDGQALSYREKASEATDCLANHDTGNPPPEGKYPIIESEVGITATDVLAVAAAVDAKRLYWKSIEAQVNRTRLQAKADVAAAAGEAEIQTILAGLIWPTPE